MAIYKRDIVDINLETGNIHRSFLKHSIGYLDQAADHFGIRLLRNGEPVDLTGVTVQGIFKPPQGNPIAITGDDYTSVEGNTAEVILPQACYNYDGQFCLSIKLVDVTNSITGTMRIVDGMVDNTHASGTVAPTGAVPTYQEVLAVYDDMVDALADVASYAANFAPEFVQGTANAAGSFVMNDGVLYLLPDGHTAGTTWANTTKTQANVGGQLSDLKSALDYESNSVSNELYDLTAITPTYSKGSINNTTGANNPINWCIRSQYMDASPGDEYCLKISDGSVAQVFFYNSSTYIPSGTPDTQIKNGSRIYTAPAGTTRWRFYLYRMTDRVNDTDVGEIISTVAATMNVYSAKSRLDAVWEDHGLLTDLGYTALTSCTKCGYYRTGSTYTSSITDLPTNFESEAFELYVTNPAFASDTFCIQTLVTVSGMKWDRVIRYSSGAWSVYRDWVLNLNANSGVTSEAFADLRNDVYTNTQINVKNTLNYYWNVEETTAVKTSVAADFYASNPISVTEGEKYTVTACQGNTDKARIWVVTDNQYNIVAMAENHKGTTDSTETFTIPQSGTILLLTCWNTANHPQTLYKIVTALDIDETDIYLKGKKLSLLGDSISAYTGTIPSGNDVYYNGTRAGVTSPNQMWWKILCDKTGMIPLVINGWSGSGVNWQTDSSHTSKVPMSDDSRCKGLHDGTTNPDVVLIAGGVNDYSYAEAAQNEPLDWDGKTVPGYTEPSTGKIVYNSFTEAYAAMIMKIQERYPDAIVVALSTWFTMRGTDTGIVYIHTVGSGASARVYTQQDYNDKIRYVAEQMHIPYIDVSNIGFNRGNYYPTYAEDSETTPTHPNAAGHHVMGNAIAIKIKDLVDGYFA